MKTMYFTLGQSHIHKCGNKVLDKDTVIKITAMDPRAEMVRLFGWKWANEFDSPPDLSFYPKGIIEIP
jgi:hypothetical protein